VPFWFHTFALNHAEGIYTPGVARDHRYRVAMPPADFAGMRVLDVGRFDGFYAFLAERRGPSGCWRSTTGSTGCGSLPAGESSWRAGRDCARAIPCWARRSGIGGWTLRARRSRRAFRCGILHRVENPLGLLRVLRGRTVRGGTVLIETYGLGPEQQDGAAIRVSRPGEVYAGDEFVCWAVGDAGLERLARIAGFSEVGPFDCGQVAGHPRIIGRLLA
jgi:hypothetical protein